jgi:glutamate dehydrogenase (NADP+)
MFGQYKRLRNEFTGVLTGKGISFGGSLIRPEATGYGCVYFAQSMLATKDDSFIGKTVVISGSGNVAQYAAEKAMQLGGKVVTMSDSSGYIHDKEGFNEEKLAYVMEIKNVRYGRIKEYLDKYPGAKYVEGGQPWEVPCDVALPCATQNELDGNEAKMLIKNGCICVAEGANMPCTPEAVIAFHEAKLLFAPGKASNAGGVATSGLEMSQNSLRLSWTREEVDDKLKDIMANIHHACLTFGTQEDGYIDYVKGANIAGFVKVADAMLAQGLV